MIPAVFAGLCDDAAVFPPGLMPLREAVPAHLRHRAARRYAGLVGPLVVSAAALDDLGALLDPADRLDVAVTLPAGPRQVPAVLASASRLPVRLCAVEVAMPAGSSPVEFFAVLDRAREQAEDTAVFVEVPRDDHRLEVIAMCAARGYPAKFRTSGATADLYPDEGELAGAIRAVCDAGVPFKATAGLHHAIRNTDPATGFEQHGFLNLLLAVHAALHGADEPALAAVLAERHAETVAGRVAGLPSRLAGAVRARLLSFGTCSISDPLTELVELGLIPAWVHAGEEATA